MKASIPRALLMSCTLLTLCACSESGNGTATTTNATSSANPITAPVDYLGAVGDAKQRAVKTVDVASLTRAVQLFQVSEDRFPKDLNELVTKQYIREIPKAPYGQKIVYDATTGKVTVEAE